MHTSCAQNNNGSFKLGRPKPTVWQFDAQKTDIQNILKSKLSVLLYRKNLILHRFIFRKKQQQTIIVFNGKISGLGAKSYDFSFVAPPGKYYSIAIMC